MLFACRGGVQQLSGADPEPLHLDSAAGALLTSVGNRSDLSEGFHVLFIHILLYWAAGEDLLYKFTNLLPECGRKNKLVVKVFNGKTSSQC